jgi:hypothetical protein
MSNSTQPMPSPPAQPSRGVSVAILILSLALAVCATSTIILGVLHFLPGKSVDLRTGVNAELPPKGSGESPMEQGGSVSPKSTFTGVVFYPIPYAAPPNLKITSAKREYDIVKQDETSFTWMAVTTLDDIRDDQRGNAQGKMGIGFRNMDGFTGMIKPNLQIEDFTWEAKGVRAGKDTVFVQQGTFNTIADKEGEVNFPIPYGVAPNAELSGQASGAVIIVESRPASFKWKNVPQKGPFAVNSGSVSWKAKGLRATEAPPPKSP